METPSAVLILCAAMSVACGSAPVKRYYTLVNNAERQDGNQAPKCALPLVMTSVMADSPYEEDKIVFRSDSFEVRYFNYRSWVEPPSDMFIGLIRRRLEISGLFEAVEHRIHSSNDHLALYAKIHAIEEIDQQDKWVARLAMSFMLKTSNMEKVVWKYEFDTQKEVLDQTVYSVVETLSVIYNEQMNLVVASLDEFIDSYEGCLPNSTP